MSGVSKSLGRELSRRMARKRLTQQDLADAIGVARVSVTAYASGRISPSLERIVAMADALGCRPSTLIASVDRDRTAKATRAIAKRRRDR